MSFATEENITEIARSRWSTASTPRLRQVMDALVRHAHAFIREIEPSQSEWLGATEYLTRTGQVSDEKRKEFILLSDVLALSMLVVMINGRKPDGATPDTVLGPFHIDDSPSLDQQGNMASDIPGIPLYLSGTVRQLSGEPIGDALLDIWQADADGLYEGQIPDSAARLRGLQRTDENGNYGFWTIAPKGYSIPMDGPVGDLIRQTEIQHFRPAHIHFIVTAEGYRPIITHLFEEGAEYIDTDVVYGTRSDLVVPFEKHSPGVAPDGRAVDTPFVTVRYDFVLVTMP